jgi:hypothetical protein
MTEYKLITEKFKYGETPPTFSETINKLISEGWQPYGDICICICSNSSDLEIAQQMLKQEGNITEYGLISNISSCKIFGNSEVFIENFLLKGWKLFGNIKTTPKSARYFQVVVKYKIFDLLQ